jgi:hypothetical protein
MKRLIVKFFAGPSESFILDGSRGRRVTPREEAHFHTGYNRASGDVHIGAFVEPRKNGLVRVGFDVIRLDLDLRPQVIERIRDRWTAESARFSKPLLKSASCRAHFSKTFAEFEISPTQLESWKEELTSILSESGSFVELELTPKEPTQ